MSRALAAEDVKGEDGLSVRARRPPGRKAETGEADYRLDEQVGFVLRKASQRHIAIFARSISDLTPPQFAALAKLHEVGATSQNQLGVLIATDAATIKGVIDRLNARNLVTLAKDDGRQAPTGRVPDAGRARNCRKSDPARP